MPVYDELLRELRGKTPEIDVDGLVVEAQRVILIDCREPDEHAAGAIAGAHWIPRGFLEAKVEKLVAERASPIVVYCASGNRSLFAQRSLSELGYSNVRSLAGGFSGWKKAGQPWETPKTLRADQDVRYSRHVLLPEVGLAGQTKLLASKVVCIGAGGLGSPSSMYLAAAGVGTLGMIDDDTVDVSNLQRQILHGTDRLGIAKVDSAERTLKNLNPDVRVDKHRVRLTSHNAIELLAPYDVIVDGADNFATRYLVNDVALRLGKPVVHASIFRFEGQLTVFSATGGPCYRCLYPQPPPPEDAPSCAEGGVLGVLPGTMGALQATEAIKLLLGIGETLAGRLLVYDALKARFRELKLRRDPKCPTCGDGVDRAAIPLVDYDQFCSAR
ncbi:MAG TPA: molybdopterin-synthase adenylyltransferase MoeB [Kofleriaceae bacterium]|jgi:molybdopterin/thiamine biosynthesis adenylyltransferase/rhodanese-related sulfurtransferase